MATIIQKAAAGNRAALTELFDANRYRKLILLCYNGINIGEKMPVPGTNRGRVILWSCYPVRLGDGYPIPDSFGSPAERFLPLRPETCPSG